MVISTLFGWWADLNDKWEKPLVRVSALMEQVKVPVIGFHVRKHSPACIVEGNADLSYFSLMPHHNSVSVLCLAALGFQTIVHECVCMRAWVCVRACACVHVHACVCMHM